MIIIKHTYHYVTNNKTGLRAPHALRQDREHVDGGAHQTGRAAPPGFYIHIYIYIYMYSSRVPVGCALKFRGIFNIVRLACTRTHLFWKGVCSCRREHGFPS